MINRVWRKMIMRDNEKNVNDEYERDDNKRWQKDNDGQEDNEW